MKLPIHIKKDEVGPTFKSAAEIIRQGFKLVFTNPVMFAYPKLASWVVPILTGLAFSFTYWLINHPLHVGGHAVRILITTGLVTYAYTGFFSSYFTCAVVATALDEMEGTKGLPVFSQLKAISKKFWRITGFGLIAFLFAPISIYARRKELRKNFIFVIGGALSLNVALLAPGIMRTNDSVAETIRKTTQVLGEAWRQSMLLKVFYYAAIFLVGSVGFLPKVAQHYWFNGSTAHYVGWIVSAILWLFSFVMLRLISSVFTAILYHKVTHNEL